MASQWGAIRFLLSLDTQEIHLALLRLELCCFRSLYCQIQCWKSQIALFPHAFQDFLAKCLVLSLVFLVVGLVFHSYLSKSFFNIT